MWSSYVLYCCPQRHCVSFHLRWVASVAKLVLRMSRMLSDSLSPCFMISHIEFHRLACSVVVSFHDIEHRVPNIASFEVFLCPILTSLPISVVLLLPGFF
ncbi:hypothetical protein GYMLUDRAFT_411027 [Collybiopsis luxurians FD-317 M1]|nr:hypothetical protein GYMLUDRAFT_411027 [Collybiopsis luxurians FD-317 M1]